MGERSTHGFGRMVQGLALGAIAMYMLDPDKGRRRRALVRDQIQRFGRDAAHLANQAARDASNRLQGVNARLDQRFGRTPEELDELRLIERVRAAMGRVVTHPHAIQVGAHGRRVVLSGPILSQEIPDLVACVRSVSGVEDVENHLDAHEPGDRLPALQGEGRQRGTGGAQTWSPAMRFATLASGAIALLYGLGRRGVTGLVVAGAGATLANRAVRGSEAMSLQRGGRMPEGRFADSWSGNASAQSRGLGQDGTGEGRARMSEPRSGDGSFGADEGVATHDMPLLGDDGTPADSLARPDGDAQGAPSQSRPAEESPMPPDIGGQRMPVPDNAPFDQRMSRPDQPPMDPRMSPLDDRAEQDMVPPLGQPFNRPPI